MTGKEVATAGGKEIAEMDPPAIRPFADVLRDVGKGSVVDEAAVMLADLVLAVRDTEKKGRLVLTVDVVFIKGSGQLGVSATAVSRPPKGNPVTAIFFADDTGNLVRDDPRYHQDPLPLREVAQPDAHIRDAR